MRYLFMLLLFCSLPVAAAPKDEVHAAYIRFLAMKSFKATISATSDKYKSNSVVEFQAPDRYRITNEGKPSNLIIGGVMYMDMNGRMMKLPMPGLKAMLAQYRNTDALKELEAGVLVEMTGSDIINKQATKKYRYTTTKPQVSVNTVWIATASGNILQIEANGTLGKKPWHSLTQYSQYNSPAIQINAP